MSFVIEKTGLPEVVLIKPKLYNDNRGAFAELYQKNKFFSLLKKKVEFVQENISFSKKNVIRGIHFQIKKPQGKLIRVLNGRIFDVIVDLRKNSSSFGKWIGVHLSSENLEQIWIPPGFGHGFMSKTNNVILSYYVTEYWKPKYERCIKWNDKDLNIKWPLTKNYKPIISKKDSKGLKFKDVKS